MNARLSKIQKNDLLYVFLLGTSALSLFSVILQISNMVGLYQLNQKEVPSLVQLVDGRAVRVTAVGSLERTPQTVHRFVSETLTLMFNWSGTLPPTTPSEAQMPKPDAGKKLSDAKSAVTTASWQASFAFSQDFRTSFLVKIAELTPREVFTGNRRAILVIRYLGEPQEIEPGYWKLPVVGDQIFFSPEDNGGRSIPFNKEVFVRSVSTPISPLGESATNLEKTVYKIREAGLEIHNIRELERQN